MRDDARIQEVMALWMNYDLSKPADDYLHFALKIKRYIGSSDRRAIREFFYQLLRHDVSLQAQLKIAEARGITAADDYESTRLVMLLHLYRTNPDDIHFLFSGRQYAPEALTASEEKLIEMAGEIIQESLTNPPVACELPQFWYEKLHSKYGDVLPDAAKSMDEEAHLDLRVNTLKTTVSEVINLLKLRDVHAVPTPYAPFGVRVMDKRGFNHTDLITQGVFEPQDEGSQLISLMCDARPGMRVVDFCAGAGGKTLSLAMHMDNRGSITASDISEHRLKRAKERLNRLEVHNAALKMIDNGWIKKHAGQFDRVLIDAPCSGSGTWRRNPDLKLRMGAQDVMELCEKQREILTSASRLVKPGGRLIYATCSLIHDENDDQVQWFLAQNPEFHLFDLAQAWPSDTPLPCTTPTWSLTPWEHGTDGFFIACLERE